MTEAWRSRFPQDLLGRYEPLSPLGAGSVGAVFLVVARAGGRRQALKVLHGTDHPTLRDRFEREVQALEALRHPAIVAIEGSGFCSKGPYLLMEHVEGSPLDQVDLPDPLGSLLKLAEGLEVVHRAGLVHRDVKPSNVLATGGDRIVLIDFGLVYDPDRSSITQTGALVGTISHMAPELLRGAPPSPASDFYAWGVTLYLLLEKKVPFPLHALIQAAGGAALPALGFERLDPGSPPARLIAACLADRPELRPVTREACTRLLEPARPRVRPAAPDPSPSVEVAVGGVDPGTPAPGAPHPLAAAGMLAVGLAVAWLAFGSRGGGSGLPPPGTPSPGPTPAAPSPLAPSPLAPSPLAPSPLPPSPLPPSPLPPSPVASPPTLPAPLPPLPPAPSDPAPAPAPPTPSPTPSALPSAPVPPAPAPDESAAPVRGLAALVDLGSRVLVGAGLDGSLHVWEPDAPPRSRTLGGEALLALDATVDLIATGGRGETIRLLERPGLAPLLTLQGHPGGTWALAFAPDGTRLASLGGDGELALWRTGDGSPAGRFRVADTPGTALAWTPDGEDLVVADQSGAIRRVGALSGVAGPALAQGLGLVRSLAILAAPDLRIAVGDPGGALLLLDPAGGVAPVRALEGDDPILVVVAHPGGRALGLGTRSGSVGLWVPGDTPPLRVVARHAGRVTALAFSPDGTVLSSAGQDSRLVRSRVEPSR